jgi:hypothetical protein
MFGYTLMMAGVTRIVEICFFASESPKISASPATTVFAAEDDNNSEHTLAEPPVTPTAPTMPRESGKEKATRAWRHLPPFVCD